MLDEYGVRLNVLGRVEMLPEKVQESVRVAQEMTRNNDRCATPGLFLVFIADESLSRRSILNLCMPYTSRDEIATAVQSAVQEKVASELDDTEYRCIPFLLVTILSCLR